MTTVLAADRGRSIVQPGLLTSKDLSPARISARKSRPCERTSTAGYPRPPSCRSRRVTAVVSPAHDVRSARAACQLTNHAPIALSDASSKSWRGRCSGVFYVATTHQGLVGRHDRRHPYQKKTDAGSMHPSNQRGIFGYVSLNCAVSNTKLSRRVTFRPWRRFSFSARTPVIGCKDGSRTMGPRTAAKPMRGSLA
jgi:hypothetical protein